MFNRDSNVFKEDMQLTESKWITVCRISCKEIRGIGIEFEM